MAHGKLGTDGVQIEEGCRNIKIEPVKRVSSYEMKKQEKCETKKQENVPAGKKRPTAEAVGRSFGKITRRSQ